MGNHRAGRRSRRRPEDTVSPGVPTSTVGKRRAAPPARSRALSRHSGSRGPLFRGLPSLPVLAGTATLAIALGGAVQVSADDLAPSSASTRQERPHASALAGQSASAGVNLLAGRSPIVSRSSSRQTLAAGATSKLVAQAEKQNQERNAALSQFRAQVEKQAQRIKENAWVMPLASYRISAGFGASSYLWSHLHTGLDLSAPSGTPIMAMAGGTVTEVGYDGSYGYKSVVTLEDGTEIWYCHQTSFAVGVGDVVRSGEVIGYVGSTGNSTGPHLHVEVRPGGGDPVDPYEAMVVHGLQP